MVDKNTVNAEGKHYELDVNGRVNAPSFKEDDKVHFTAEEQISIIQKTLGIEQTGEWDTETNKTYTLWLRLKQAEFGNIESADGWWGNNTQKALEGKIDAETFNAIKGLYERKDGNLNNLTWRNEYHNASWKLIKEKAKTAPFANPADGEIAWEAAIPGGTAGLVAEKAAQKLKGKPELESKASPEKAVQGKPHDADAKKLADEAKVKDAPNAAKGKPVVEEDTIKAEEKAKGKIEANELKEKVPTEAEAKVKGNPAEIIEDEPKATRTEDTKAKTDVDEASKSTAPEVDEKVKAAMEGEHVATPEAEAKIADTAKAADGELAKAARMASEIDAAPATVVEEIVDEPAKIATEIETAPVTEDLKIEEPVKAADTTDSFKAVSDVETAPVTENLDTPAPAEAEIKTAEPVQSVEAETIKTDTPVVEEKILTEAENVTPANIETVPEIKADTVEPLQTVAEPETAPVIEETKTATPVETVEADTPKVDTATSFKEVAATPVAETAPQAPASSAAKAGAVETTLNVDKPVFQETITIPATKPAEETGGFLSRIWGIATDTPSGKMATKAAKTLARGLPWVGAGIAAAEVTHNDNEALAAINAGLLNEESLTALRGGYGAHVTQSGIDPTMFGGEIGTSKIFNEVSESYHIDPVTLDMIRPMFIADLADDLFDDGMPDLNAEQIKTIRDKYSAENMQSVYGRIIEQYGLPGNVAVEGEKGKMSIIEAVKDESVMERLQTAFSGNEDALKGLSALSFASRTADKAHDWVKAYDRAQRYNRFEGVKPLMDDKPMQTSALSNMNPYNSMMA